MLTSTAMRRIVSRGMIIGMAAPRMVAAGIPRVISAVTRMITAGLTRMIAARSRMVSTRRPDSTGGSCHGSRSIPAL